MVDFKGKDILSGAQFTRGELEHILEVAGEMREQLKANRITFYVLLFAFHATDMPDPSST